jgi:LysM repeat protein
MAIALLAGARSGWSQQYYIYTPQAVAEKGKIQKKDGVLVREIPVKKGDTLYRISRKFSGHGSYYPQILLFNDIKNPDRIYPGKRLKIPVSRIGAADRAVNGLLQDQAPGAPSAGPVPAVPAGDLKKGAAAGAKRRDTKHKTAAAAISPPRNAHQPASAVAATSEQRQYESAITVYRQGNYRAAVELFDRFLADYPSSARAAEASLYKAECYLKQSNQ